MLKRILSFLLVLVMVFSLLPASVLAAEIDEETPAGAEDVALDVPADEPAPAAEPAPAPAPAPAPSGEEITPYVPPENG